MVLAGLQVAEGGPQQTTQGGDMASTDLQDEDITQTSLRAPGDRDVTFWALCGGGVVVYGVEGRRGHVRWCASSDRELEIWFLFRLISDK